MQSWNPPQTSSYKLENWVKDGGGQEEGEKREEKRESESVSSRGRVTKRGKRENLWGLRGAVGSLDQELLSVGNTKPTNTSKLWVQF